jgi:hypothetical protein
MHTQFPQPLLESLHQLAQAGSSPQTISLALGLKLEVVEKELGSYPRQITKSISQSELLKHSFIYSYSQGKDTLMRTNLITAEDSCFRVPSSQFKSGCCWSELPGGSLLITGGGWPLTREAVRIDTLKEFVVSEQPPMLTPRAGHACVYHCELLYVLGGYTGSTSLRDCERYVLAESRWEALAPLPIAASGVSAVVLENSLYALGGMCHGRALDVIQKLRLDRITWECLEFKLPQVGQCLPCFKLRDTEGYLVIKDTLYSFTPLQVLPLKTLPKVMQSWRGSSHYSRGTLYCSNYAGAAFRLEIGSLGEGLRP